MTVPFETLALLLKDDKGGINQEKAKELIKVFRPERDGTIGKIEFVKSIDAVYKQLRLLSANISNSSQIDKAIESLFNVVFYIIVGCYALTRLGEDPTAIFFSFSSVILGFAFMFGYVDLSILLRSPCLLCLSLMRCILSVAQCFKVIRTSVSQSFALPDVHLSNRICNCVTALPVPNTLRCVIFLQ